MSTINRDELRALVRSEFGADVDAPWPAIVKWLDRGDGVAVYENVDLGSSDLGELRFLSYGSSAAQLETPEPPLRMPDIGAQIGWRFQLVAVCKD